MRSRTLQPRPAYAIILSDVLCEKAVQKKLIDQSLAVSGWRVVDYGRWQIGDRMVADAVEDLLTDSGPGICVLMLDGPPVADVKAKRLETGRENVIERAKC